MYSRAKACSEKAHQGFPNTLSEMAGCSVCGCGRSDAFLVDQTPNLKLPDHRIR